ncbi:MAG: alpha/beta fold hydrolase [Burkholderiales bacterium]
MDHTLKRPDGCDIFYTVDDCTDPWRKPETMLFVHGLAESGEAWRAWVPHFMRRYRVVRMDLRGFGRSTAMPAEHEWSMDELLDDIEALIRHLGCARVHLIGAKSGGSMALTMAAHRPSLVRTLIGVTPPVLPAAGVDDWVKHINSKGVLDWARYTMQGRLGSAATQAEIDWWVHNLQGRTPLSTLQGYLRWVPKLDIREDVKRITCPTLIITTTGSGLRSVDGVKAWVSQVKSAELLVLDGDAWHAAGAYPDRCAQATLEFLDRNTSTAKAA